MTAAPAPRLSPWWMLAPALLFIANFVAGLVASGKTSNNAVYNASAIVGTVVVDLVLIGYVLFAAWISHRPVAPTLALRRTPLRPAIKLGALALALIVVSNIVLEPLLHASERQGIAPTHDPRSTHQWVVLSIAIVGLVVVAPAAEELVFRGLGFATLGRFALPLTTALFAVAHGLAVLLIPVAIAGLLLGLIRERTNSVFPGMGVHMSLNALALGLALLVS
ncbi:MAG TPA: type II CAAX endopeptidase family protein [Gaiellales bacterium]